MENKCTVNGVLTVDKAGIFCELLLFMLIGNMFCDCNHNGGPAAQHTASHESLAGDSSVAVLPSVLTSQ